jgi:diguanylate cyclase (GGDEF)-like protein
MTGFHVLLVDDSQTVLEMLSYVLSSAGFSVTTAADGIEGLTEVFRRTPDLILMDIRAPRVGGIQACRLLKADPARRDVPVILLSSQQIGSERIHAERAGADRLLLKDSTPEKIVDASRECLAGKSPRPVSEDDPKEADKPGNLEVLLRVNQIQEARLFEATLFNEIGAVGREVDDFETTMRAMARILSDLVPHDALAAVFADGIRLESVIVYPFDASEEIRRATREATERVWSEAGVPAAPGGTSVVEYWFDGRYVDAEPAPERFRPWIQCPIRSGEMVKGVLCLFSEGDAASAKERLTEALLRHAFVVMENAWLYRQISRMSATDGLTQLTNRRHFVECLKREHSRSSRHRLPYSILIADIDHFKKINDVYGHLVGDTVLREFSAILREQCRDADHPARYGGEEFVVLLPGTGGKDGSIVADRIRQAVERKIFASPSPLIRVTVSIGVSAFDPEAPRNDQEVLDSADQALYAAKHGGRNQVCVQ